MIVLIIFLKFILYLNNGKYCEKNVYYFNYGGKYLKADYQKFLISFTGEVGNAWFTVGNFEYKTKDYYKKIEIGEYNINGECILWKY